MALYLGNHRSKIKLNSVRYRLASYSQIPTITRVRLLSSDNYVLKDSNGLYLTAKDGE